MSKVQKNQVRDKVYSTLLGLLQDGTPKERAFLDLFKKYSPFDLFETLDSCEEFIKTDEIRGVVRCLKRSFFYTHAICESWDIEIDRNVKWWISFLHNSFDPITIHRRLEDLQRDLITTDDDFRRELSVIFDIKQVYFVLAAQENNWNIERYLKAA